MLPIRSCSFVGRNVRFTIGICGVIVLCTPCLAQRNVQSTSRCRVADGNMHAYAGVLDLPADGLWQIKKPEGQNGISELYLLPSQPSRIRQLGSRMFAALEERQIQNGRWQVSMGFEACRQFAQERDGLGPQSIEDLASDKRWQYLSDRWNRLYWRANDLKDLMDVPMEGPFVHLVPEVRFQFVPLKPAEIESGTQRDGQPRVPRRVVPKDKRSVLAFELRPFVDDGLHWVLHTDGTCERVEIDPDLLDRHGVKIRPIVDQKQLKADAEEPNLEYKIVLVSSEPINETLKLSAHNLILDQNVEIQWTTEQGEVAAYSDLRKTIAQARRFAWQPYRLAGNGGVLDVWDAATAIDPPTGNARRSLSMFSVLGGRAAIEETLQLQNLAVSEVGDRATVDVDSLKGVVVKSHPFEEMLGGQPGGHLEMAHYVPHDRFFLYVGKPESITALLDTAAPFIASAGATVTGNSLKYNLEARYLARLGMTRDWVDAVLASGMTSEMGLFAPDLFFIDGTDVTIVMKLNQPKLFRKMLSFLGAAELTSRDVMEIPTTDGGNAYLGLRDNLLFAGTSRSELKQSLELFENQGEGSLGASAEFRYMLTKLPVNEETRLYAYLSDPFVRRLVGPQVKLAQRRRVLAKAQMEALTAQTLLARLDGHPHPDSVPELVRDGYLPKSFHSDQVSIDAAGLVRSERYGSLPRMRTLPETPLEKVTPEEAEAYRQYQENYSRYWRRFFDPIAVRLDEVGTDQLELSTFILPLVDNSIYNGLRMVLAHQDDQSTLSVPIVEPAPVVQFSVNLNEQAWQQIAGNFSEFFRRYSGASPAMLDDFGPGIHVAVFDADPIIAMGSGDVFGAFGGDVLRGRGNDMLMLPVALSMLTRPCSIMVETRSPERTAQYLRQAALVGIQRDRRTREFNVSFHQVGDRDQWVWTLDLFGVVKLRYGVEVVGKYMVIRNIPWSSEDRVVSVEPAELNAAVLQANPSACRQQLPGLFAAASDANRRAVMSGIGRLYPFMLGGAASVQEAAKQHNRLFGFYPVELTGDRWDWRDYRLVSEDFGEPTRQRQPAFDPQQPFGLMNRIDSLRLNMQFEQDGLRSTVRWRLR